MSSEPTLPPQGGPAPDAALSNTPATLAAAESGVPHRIIRYGRAHSIEEAAELRGVPVASVVKTLVVRRGEDDFVLVCVSGDRSIDWPKLRDALGVNRVTMADTAALEEITGYVRGAVTPFGSLGGWPLIVDKAVADLPDASLGGGAHGVAINLMGSDLVTAFSATVADVSK